MAALARTYDSALEKLAALQSNRAVTSLFSGPQQSSTTAQDLNNDAISEMLSWLVAAGLTTQDLEKLNCIHVAGTKGKGSVCAFLTAVLTQQEIRDKYGRVGTYTSPHLVSVRERIMLDGQPISHELFAKYFYEIWDAFTNDAKAQASKSDAEMDLSELEGPATKPFYFRFLTILAFYVFLKEGVSSAIIECGIGGEYDSTNVLPKDAVSCSVVTQLGIDHVGMLGKTLPEIAWHKTGIAKEGRKVFTRRLTGSDGDAAMEVMRERTRHVSAELHELVDEDVDSWQGFVPGAGGLEGDFQRHNQALAACAAYEQIRFLEAGSVPPASESPPKLDEIPEELRRFQLTKLRGRCEIIVEDRVTWLVDGAHTEESLQEVAKWFKMKQFPADAKLVLVFNQQERDAPELLKSLHGEIQRPGGPKRTKSFTTAIFTRNELSKRTETEPERNVDVQNATAKAMRNMSPETLTMVCDNVGAAVNEIRKWGLEKPGGRAVVLVTGSLYLVGALLRTLEPDAPI